MRYVISVDSGAKRKAYYSTYSPTKIRTVRTKKSAFSYKHAGDAARRVLKLQNHPDNGHRKFAVEPLLD